MNLKVAEKEHFNKTANANEGLTKIKEVFNEVLFVFRSTRNNSTLTLLLFHS